MVPTDSWGIYSHFQRINAELLLFSYVPRVWRLVVNFRCLSFVANIQYNWFLELRWQMKTHKVLFHKKVGIKILIIAALRYIIKSYCWIRFHSSGKYFKIWILFWWDRYKTCLSWFRAFLPWVVFSWIGLCSQWFNIKLNSNWSDLWWSEAINVCSIWFPDAFDFISPLLWPSWAAH